MELPAFIDLVGGLGSAGGVIFAALWWMERSERRDAHKFIVELIERHITATEQNTSAIRAIRDLISAGGGSK